MTKTIRDFCSRSLIKIIPVLVLALMLSGCKGSDMSSSKGIRIAVLTYDEYDTFIDGMTKYMTKWCRQKEKENGIRITQAFFLEPAMRHFITSIISAAR